MKRAILKQVQGGVFTSHNKKIGKATFCAGNFDHQVKVDGSFCVFGPLSISIERTRSSIETQNSIRGEIGAQQGAIYHAKAAAGQVIQDFTH